MNVFGAAVGPNEGQRQAGEVGGLLNQPFTVSINGMVEQFRRKVLKKADKLWLVISL
jgi:hypothetical protein